MHVCMYACRYVGTHAVYVHDLSKLSNMYIYIYIYIYIYKAISATLMRSHRLKHSTLSS